MINHRAESERTRSIYPRRSDKVRSEMQTRYKPPLELALRNSQQQNHISHLDANRMDSSQPTKMHLMLDC